MDTTSRSNAATLNLNGSANGTIDPEDDQDYFKLELSQATEVAIRASGFPDTVGNRAAKQQRHGDSLQQRRLPPEQQEDHGTAVAGLIAAKDNSLGMRGVAFRATIYGYNYLAEESLDQRSGRNVPKCGDHGHAATDSGLFHVHKATGWGTGDSGLPVTATDPDSDPLIYSLGGPDLVSFDLVSGRRRLR